MKKRIKLTSVLILILLTLCGCNSDDYETPNEMIARYMQTIMDGVINQETESIEELFCSYVKDTHTDLESEIIGLFDFIEGDIISYDEPIGRRGGGRRTEDGIIKESMGGLIENIKTSTGKTYSMGYGGYRIYKECPEYVGITDLTIRDEDAFIPGEGYSEEGVYEIYSPEMWE